MLRFNRSHLPLNKKMQDFWDINGFLVIEDFYAHEECDKLIYKSEKLINDFDADSVKSIFDTKNQNHVDDNYFYAYDEKHQKGSSGGPALVRSAGGSKYAVAGIIVGKAGRARAFMGGQEKCEWMLNLLHEN